MKFAISKHPILPRPGSQPPTLPSRARQAVNFAKAARDTIREAVTTGRVMVETEEQLKRKAICLACETFNADKERCAHPDCGCYMKLKTWLTSQKCPVNKW